MAPKLDLEKSRQGVASMKAGMILTVLFLSSAAQAGWFSPTDSSENICRKKSLKLSEPLLSIDPDTRCYQDHLPLADRYRRCFELVEELSRVCNTSVCHNSSDDGKLAGDWCAHGRGLLKQASTMFLSYLKLDAAEAQAFADVVNLENAMMRNLHCAYGEMDACRGTGKYRAKTNMNLIGTLSSANPAAANRETLKPRGDR